MSNGLHGNKWEELATPTLPLPPHLSQQAKEDVSVKRPLVGLVHDDSTVLVKVWFPETLTQQNPISHVLDDGGLQDKGRTQVIRGGGGGGGREGEERGRRTLLMVDCKTRTGLK